MDEFEAMMVESELTQLEKEFMQNLDRRFLDSLTEENQKWVIETERMRDRWLESVQMMLVETDGSLRMLHAHYVSKHAEEVAERTREVNVMRIKFTENDIQSFRIGVESPG